MQRQVIGVFADEHVRQQPRIPLTAPIGGNGDLDVSDGLLKFTIASGSCEHHWTMRQVN